MARFVTISGTSVDLLVGLGGSHLIDSFTNAFLLDDGFLITTDTTPTASPIVPPLVSPPPVSTAFLPTATFDPGVLATTGTMGSAVVAGTTAPLGDQFAHAISDWLMDL